MPQPLLQKYEIFTGGENLAVEPERLPPTEFEEIRNWDIADDAWPEAAPGYAVEFTVPKKRQLCTCENGLDSQTENWHGDVSANTTTGQRRYGFQSQKHTHTADSTKDSFFLRDLTFIKGEFDTTGVDELNFFFFFGDVSEISEIDIQFLDSAGTSFFNVELDSFIPGTNDTGVNIVVPFNSALITKTGSPSFDWDQVQRIRILTMLESVWSFFLE